MNGDDDTEYLFVSEYFHPDEAVTGKKMTEMAVGLRERGLDVRVLTGQPNYHSGDNERQPRLTVHEGVPVKRVAAPQLRQSSLPRRLFNWAVFTAWMFFALLFSRAPADRDRELLFVSNPPMLPPALWLVCRLRGWEYTYVVHDLVPDQPVELGYLSRDGLVTRAWKRLDDAAFRGARRVLVHGPVMEDRIAKRVGEEFDRSKVRSVDNWEDPEFVRPLPKSENPFCAEHGLQDTFTLLYSWNHAEFHDLDTLVRAAARFDPDELQVVIIGDGDRRERTVALAEELGVAGGVVTFLPWQPRDRLQYSLTAGDVSVVTVEEGFAGVCLSSKLFSSLAAGTPILGIVPQGGEEDRVIGEAEAGITVAPGDIDGAVEAIERWRSDPALVERQGENTRRVLEERYTLETALDAYHDALVE